MVNRLNLSSFGHFRPKVLNFGKLKHFHSFSTVLVIGSLSLLFLVAIGSAYFYTTNSFPQPIIHENVGDNRTNTNFSGECNLFVGNWVPNESYPLYNASECPFAEQGFSCLDNGRKDKEYLKWRWKPSNCEIPSFDVHVILEKFRGKRIVFVGDSLSRTQWESMICILMTGVEDKSIFLVQPGSPPKRLPKMIKKVLMVDKLDDINK
ncbi:protein trichome berefringence-like 7 [Nicotiana tabacum]|uniref:Protein trichome berefringence-like 7 n=1 Tax=Nicotiana tabacum TaxID=4097 RepID=A0AC58SEN8_TOBAC